MTSNETMTHATRVECAMAFSARRRALMADFLQSHAVGLGLDALLFWAEAILRVNDAEIELRAGD